MCCKVKENFDVSQYGVSRWHTKKRDSEISKWLIGRHNFTTQTIARIETALDSKLISIAH